MSPEPPTPDDASPIPVLFDATAIAPPLTGIGRYAQELLRGLLARPEAVAVAALHRGRPVAAAGLLDAPAAEGGGAGALRRTLRTIPLAHETHHWLRARLFARSARRLGARLYHEPNYVLKPFAGACVVTCHDLSHLRYPAFHPRERVRFLERHLEPSLRRAARVIVPSAFVRDELASAFGLDAGRIAVVPEGVGVPFGALAPAEVARALAALGLAPEGYVLSVATFEPRKNLEAVVAAYEALPPALRARFPLVLAGPRGWKEGALLARLERLERAGAVRLLGYLGERELAAAYAGARAFLFLSHYEGFGLPVLEAMASGAPVIASAGSALPELVGEAAITVAPDDAAAATDALARLIEDEALRACLAARGRARSAALGWDRCAAATIAVYREALTA